MVRIAPDELSYTSSAAWKKIYGQKTPEFEKCLDGRGIAPRSLEGVKGIINEDQERHSRLRRAINPAFSERAIREQEVFLQLYSDKLVSCLLRDVKNGEAVDILRWVHLTTFDVISDLAFGQPAGCLDNADQPWLQIIGARAKAIVWHQFEMIYDIDRMLHKIWPTRFSEVRRKHIELTTAKVLHRIKQKEDQKVDKDFMSYILDNETENLTKGELIVMASAFIVAGSGTVGAAVSGAIFHLCRNPRVYQLLVEEIRGRFSSESEITIQSTGELRYLKAVIEESLRIYPPSPSTLPRFVPGKGEMIEGKWVPGGVSKSFYMRHIRILIKYDPSRLQLACILFLHVTWSPTFDMPDPLYQNAGLRSRRTTSQTTTKQQLKHSLSESGTVLGKGTYLFCL